MLHRLRDNLGLIDVDIHPDALAVPAAARARVLPPSMLPIVCPPKMRYLLLHTSY